MDNIQQKIDAIAKLTVSVAVSILAITVIANLLSIHAIKEWEVKPKDVLEEVKGLRDTVAPAVADRFRGQEHREFLNAFFRANPELVRPEGY